MKMMIAFRWTSTPITPMMKSAAVSARDSASTDGPPAPEHHRAGDGDEEQDAGELEGEQVVPEQWLRDRTDGVQLLQLLLVEITRHYQLLRQLRTENHHDLAQQAESDEPGGQLPTRTARGRQLRWMPEIEEHDDEQEHHHDRAGVDQHLHYANELRIEHDVQGGEAEHRIDQPQRRGDRALARDESDRRGERDDAEQIEMKDVEERVVRLGHCPFGSSGSHISHTGCV